MPNNNSPLPDWYVPEEDVVTGHPTTPNIATLPPWLQQVGAQRNGTPALPLPTLPSVPLTTAVPQMAAQWRRVDPTAQQAGPSPSNTPASNKQSLPDWYTPEQPDEAPAQPAPKANTSAWADWYTPEPPEQPQAAPVASNKGSLPSWYTPDPDASPPASAQPTQAPDYGFLKNVVSSLTRVPGVILSLPRTLAHTADWMTAQEANALSDGKTNFAGADFDKTNPLMKVLPSSDDVDKVAFKAASAASHAVGGPAVEPYTPTTVGGRLGSAALTGAAAAAVDPMADAASLAVGWNALKQFVSNAAKAGAASAAAQGAQEVFPNNPALAAAFALLTHTGTSAATAGARAAGTVAADAGRQVLTPTRAGLQQAARTLQGVENTLPTLAQPSVAELTGAQGDVQSATNNIGPGLEPWQAGEQLRNSLQSRVNDLEQARDDATAPLRMERDTSPAVVNVDPVMNLIKRKLNVAAGPQQDAISGALADLHLANGSPREDAEQLAASRTAINARINAATRAGDDASAAHLIDIRNALDKQISAAVPEAGQYTEKYAELSRPLDPTQYGPVAKVLDRDQFNSRYTFPDERIPDAFLRSSATRADLGQLVSAFGGDKDAALGALEQHLAGLAQRAVNPDGTLDSAAFGRAMAPYEKTMRGNLNYWFPQLAAKFKSARAAQDTLDTMQAQRSLADSVTGGALRDGNGAITGHSFGRWFNANRDTIAKTQSSGAVTRLQQIAFALRAPQGELADALKSEIMPTALGYAFGGTEGGILGSMLHKTGNVVFSGLDAKRLAAFNGAIEKATLDPQYAAKLTAEMGRQGRTVSPARALVRAIYATPIAVNAGRAKNYSH